MSAHNNLLLAIPVCISSLLEDIYPVNHHITYVHQSHARILLVSQSCTRELHNECLVPAFPYVCDVNDGVGQYLETSLQ